MFGSKSTICEEDLRVSGVYSESTIDVSNEQSVGRVLHPTDSTSFLSTSLQELGYPKTGPASVGSKALDSSNPVPGSANRCPEEARLPTNAASRFAELDIRCCADWDNFPEKRHSAEMEIHPLEPELAECSTGPESRLAAARKRNRRRS